MAEQTGIAWTRSTFNPWLGCTRVSPGCDHCYAAVSRPVMAMGIKWGAGEPRRRTSAHNWKLPKRWDREARKERETGVRSADVAWSGPVGFWPVFCASLADVFDNEVPVDWRIDLFALIAETPNLTWLLLTKRIGNAVDMIPPNPWTPDGGWPNVWLGSSVVNQMEADRDLPKLLAVQGVAKRFVSNEPALGPIIFGHFLHSAGLNWVICGGESNQGGAEARPFDIGWARSTVEQCRAAGVAPFVKQLGSRPFCVARHANDPDTEVLLRLHHRAGADPAEWPAELRVQEFPL